MSRVKSNFLSNLRRFYNPAGFILLLLISISFAFIIKSAEIKGAALLLIALVGPVLACAIVAYPRFGIVAFIIASNMLTIGLRINFTTFPLGTVIDGIEALLILGLFIKQKYEPDWSFLKSPVSIMVIIWIVYNILQIFNPAAASKMAWVYTIRSLAIIMLTYFIFSYHVRSKDFIRLLIKLWLGLAVIGAIYGFKQQFFGFFAFEEAYLYSDPIIASLLFIGGVWRKFSIYSDPVNFSYIMVISSLMCVGLMFGEISRLKKWILVGMVFLFLTNMLFSGTRSAYILFPAGMGLLAILKFNKKVLLYTALAGIFVVFLIKVPTSNSTLYRFQTAFQPSNDASFNLRSINKKLIRPYIQSHPFGGGLGSTGAIAAKLTPGTFLASFPPDSGFVRTAVEAGWVGLLIQCILFFTIMKAGIESYYSITDPELKSYCLAMVLIVFVFNIGNYPQEALTQVPLNLYFFLVAALIDVMRVMDKKDHIKSFDKQLKYPV